MSTRLSELRRDVEAADSDINALRMELAEDGIEWVSPKSPSPHYNFEDERKNVYQSHIECYDPAFLKVASASDVDSQVGAVARLEQAARGTLRTTANPIECMPSWQMTRQTRAREVSDALARSTARIQEIHRLIGEHNATSPLGESVSPHRRVGSPELLMSPALPKTTLEPNLSPLAAPVDDLLQPVGVVSPAVINSQNINPLDYIKEIPIGGELSPVIPTQLLDCDMASPPHAALIAPVPHREPILSNIVPVDYIVPVGGSSSPLLPRNGTPVGSDQWPNAPPPALHRTPNRKVSTKQTTPAKGYYSAKAKMARHDTINETAAGWANFLRSPSSQKRRQPILKTPSQFPPSPSTARGMKRTLSVNPNLRKKEYSKLFAPLSKLNTDLFQLNSSMAPKLGGDKTKRRLSTMPYR